MSSKNKAQKKVAEELGGINKLKTRPRKMMSLKGIEAWDKKRSARHEAGHLCYAIVKDVGAHAWLYRDPKPPRSWRQALDTKYWHGRTVVIRNWNLSVLERTAFGMSGAIAEVGFEDGFHDLWPEYILDCWDDLGFSETDLALMSPRWNVRYRAAEDAIQVLTGNKRLLERIASTLIVHEVFPRRK